MKQFLGIDIGGTNIKIGLVKENGVLLDKKKIPTGSLRDQDNFIDNFVQTLVDGILSYKEVLEVGIALPGTLTKDRKGTVELTNIPELNHISLKNILEKKLPNHTFFLENDANVAAIGEYHFTDQKVKTDSFLFLTLGTGLGSSVILDKKLFIGGSGNAMELGHIVASNGKTIEMNTGRHGMITFAQELMAKNPHSLLHQEEYISPRTIENAAEKGDKNALDVFEMVGKFLGEGIIASLRILDIDTVIIGGGISPALPYILPTVNITLKNYLTPYYLNKLTIRQAKLGNDAGILGAAALCI
ncbi:MAG: ROK family protein [Cytophagales bacterium]|nr:ROK family protein [Cytophagales bacterium]